MPAVKKITWIPEQAQSYQINNEKRPKDIVKVKIPVQTSLLPFTKFVLAVTAEYTCVPNVNKICNVLHRSNVWGAGSFQSYQEWCKKNKNDFILVSPMLILSISNTWIWFIPFRAMPPFCTHWKYQKNGDNIRKRNIA